MFIVADSQKMAPDPRLKIEHKPAAFTTKGVHMHLKAPDIKETRISNCG
jgi:hypothetical protein